MHLARVRVFGTRKWPIGSNGYTNFGKVVVVVVVVVGGVGEGGGGCGVKAAPIACLTFTFTRGPPFIQNKIRFVLLSYLPVDDKTFLLIMCFYVSLDWGKTNLD